LVLVGCGRSLLLDAIPIEYESVELVCGSYGLLHDRAGIHYSLSNLGSREVVALLLAFDLYHAAGGDALEPFPRQNGNSFSVNVSAPLASGSRRSFVTSLDEIVATAVESLELRRFRVQKAHFADGTTWKNHGGYVWEEE
jgi:hypothetical protein